MGTKYVNMLDSLLTNPGNIIFCYMFLFCGSNEFVLFSYCSSMRLLAFFNKKWVSFIHFFVQEQTSQETLGWKQWMWEQTGCYAWKKKMQFCFFLFLCFCCFLFYTKNKLHRSSQYQPLFYVGGQLLVSHFEKEGGSEKNEFWYGLKELLPQTSAGELAVFLVKTL